LRALSITCLVLALAATAPVAQPRSAGSANAAFDHKHSAFSALLSHYVSEGKVDYAGLAEDRKLLQGYLTTLSALPPGQMARFSPDQRLAMHINAYNAFVLELILDHYPVDSPQDIDRAFTRQWFRFVGEPMSLQGLLDRRILGQFKDPLLHFALVQAAQGSPELRAEAWTSPHIHRDLDDAARRFARDPSRFELDQEAGVLRVSALFDWHWTDFQSRWGGTPLPGDVDEPARHRVVIGFYRDYGDEETAAYLAEHPVRIEYLDFDWSLNAISTD